MTHTGSRSHHPSNRYFMQATQTRSWCWRFSLKAMILFTTSSCKEGITRRLLQEHSAPCTGSCPMWTSSPLGTWKNKLLQITMYMVSFGTGESDQYLFQCAFTTFTSSPCQLLFLEWKSSCKSAEVTKLLMQYTKAFSCLFTVMTLANLHHFLIYILALLLQHSSAGLFPLIWVLLSYWNNIFYLCPLFQECKYGGKQGFSVLQKMLRKGL